MSRSSDFSFIVDVWGKACEVRVHQKSKSAWIASGEYMGQSVVSNGSTAQSAVVGMVSAVTECHRQWRLNETPIQSDPPGGIPSGDPTLN